MSTVPPMRKMYHALFFAANGIGPYPCCFCGHDVEMNDVVVHHVDGDHANDVVENLAAAHTGCHTRYHNTGRRRPDISLMNVTRVRSQQELEKMRRSARTPEGRAQKSRAGKAGAAKRWGR